MAIREPGKRMKMSEMGKNGFQQFRTIYNINISIYIIHTKKDALYYIYIYDDVHSLGRAEPKGEAVEMIECFIH